MRPQVVLLAEPERSRWRAARAPPARPVAAVRPIHSRGICCVSVVRIIQEREIGAAIPLHAPRGVNKRLPVKVPRQAVRVRDWLAPIAAGQEFVNYCDTKKT